MRNPKEPENCAHGNPYYRLLRAEVEALARELRGTRGVKEQKMAHEMAMINKELNSLKRKLTKLEKQKAELTIKMKLLADDPSAPG